MQNIMCKRPITPEEAKPIFTDGKSTLLEDFTSRRNKPFNAFLKLEKNRVAYDFPPRAAAADAKRFPVVPGVVAVCPKTKANIVETETHYTTEDNSTDCKIHLERCISKRDITREEARHSSKPAPWVHLTTSSRRKPTTRSVLLKEHGYKFAKALELRREGRLNNTFPEPKAWTWDWTTSSAQDPSVGVQPPSSARTDCVLMAEEHEEVVDCFSVQDWSRQVRWTW